MSVRSNRAVAVLVNGDPMGGAQDSFLDHLGYFTRGGEALDAFHLRRPLQMQATQRIRPVSARREGLRSTISPVGSVWAPRTCNAARPYSFRTRDIADDPAIPPPRWPSFDAPIRRPNVSLLPTLPSGNKAWTFGSHRALSCFFGTADSTSDADGARAWTRAPTSRLT